MKNPTTLPVLALLGCAAMLLPSCRSSSDKGEPEMDPKEAQPREVIEPTQAERERNDRFGDMRKRRYEGAKMFDESPPPAGEGEADR